VAKPIAANGSGREQGPAAPTVTTDGQAVVDLVNSLLRRALTCGASDVHFEPTDDPRAGLLVRLRRDGVLHDFETLPSSVAASVVGRLKVMAGLLTYRIDIPQEGSLRFKAADHDGADSTELRVATFPTIRGERAVVRVFSNRSKVERIDDLGFDPAQVGRLCAAVEAPAGMVVATGPAGAGKSTTLYSLVRHIRERTPGRSIVTVEDPVEQRIDGVTQIQIDPQGELDYEVCMRSLLRQDPQVLLIGEIRDARTVSAAVEAALTGHLILTTIHSGDPAEAVLRLLEMGAPPYQVVSVVTLVCSQRLLRRRADQAECSADNPVAGDGYCGRIACGQVVTMTEPLRELVLRHPTASQLRAAMQNQQPDLPAAANRLVRAGVTDVREVRRVLGEVASAE
jgi:general secretion pathway protein E